MLYICGAEEFELAKSGKGATFTIHKKKMEVVGNMNFVSLKKNMNIYIEELHEM